MRRTGELLRIDGRVAIVTGGAGHLGLALGEALSEFGAHVVVVDLAHANAEKRALALAAHGGVETMGLGVDLADPAQADTVVERTLRRFGRLDILVHNAALTGSGGLPGYAVPFPDQTLEAWDAALRINLSAAFLLARAARSALAASGHGVIVNIASIYGVLGPDLGLYEGTTMGNPAAYGASKAGLLQLTRYLATALAPSIRVNAISPGGLERGQPPEFQARYRARAPLGRMGREEDMKGAMIFLASDASAYVTGQNLMVDGGWSAW
jgi:NAD(P)-dependent dehydrogenase (short-subunit alcohol dehydrogenase family)